MTIADDLPQSPEHGPSDIPLPQKSPSANSVLPIESNHDNDIAEPPSLQQPLAADAPVLPEHALSMFLRGAMEPTVDFAMHPWREMNSMDQLNGLLDFLNNGAIDFENVDLSLLDGTNAAGMIENAENQRQTQHEQRFGLGKEAFSRSALGFWVPARHDCVDSEFKKLEELNIDEASNTPDNTQIGRDQQVLIAKISGTSRDLLLAMVMSSCKLERALHIVKVFPSPELLDDIVQYFFYHHAKQMDDFVHAPTFDPNKQQPELLGAIIALGASMSGIQGLYMFGFALQEAVRLALRARFEGENSMTRELCLLQAFMCTLRIGMWSGIKRKMEIAESHMHIALNILRRGGYFLRLKGNPASWIPSPADTGEVLERKWHGWIEQESFKRLVFHAFLFDAQVSIAMLTDPIISYSELAIPLPECRELWEAVDAKQWKTLYLRWLAAHPNLSSLLDFLQLQPPALSLSYDVHLSSMTILSGVWGIIWQHLRLASTQKRFGQVYVSTTFRHQELLQTLHIFRASTCGNLSVYPPVRLILELLCMHLHTNLEDLQLFAGKESLEDARRVFPPLQQWASSPESRHALWHAGQVLRIAREFPLQQLFQFYSIAIYHAGLTLWAYGVISLSQPRAANTISTPAGTTVCLDGPESAVTQSFLSIGSGSPCIQLCRETEEDIDVIALSNPEGVMNVVAATLKRNFPSQMMPPLVQNLVQLVQDLGKASSNL